jgi:hypothetical protein
VKEKKRKAKKGRGEKSQKGGQGKKSQRGGEKREREGGREGREQGSNGGRKEGRKEGKEEGQGEGEGVESCVLFSPGRRTGTSDVPAEAQTPLDKKNINDLVGSMLLKLKCPGG